MSAQSDFYNRVRPDAQRASKATGIPTETIMAQWALESRYGQAKPMADRNNFAGIMRAKPGGGQELRTYGSMSEFTDAYIKVANQANYNAARTPDPAKAAVGLGVGKWDANLYREKEGSGTIGKRLVDFMNRDRELIAGSKYGKLLDNDSILEKKVPVVKTVEGLLDGAAGGVVDVAMAPVIGAIDGAGTALDAGKTVVDAATAVPEFLGKLSNPKLWRRVGIGAAGAIAVTIGAVLVLRIQTKGKI